jgi:hypothetical protein
MALPGVWNAAPGAILQAFASQQQTHG